MSNTAIKLRETLSTIKRIQNISNDLNLVQLAPHLTLLKEGILTKISKGHVQQRLFFVFSSLVVYGIPKPKGMCKYRGHIWFDKAEIHEPENPLDHFPYSFEILRYDKQKVITLCPISPIEKQEWFSIFEKCINNVKINGINNTNPTVDASPISTSQLTEKIIPLPKWQQKRFLYGFEPPVRDILLQVSQDSEIKAQNSNILTTSQYHIPNYFDYIKHIDKSKFIQFFDKWNSIPDNLNSLTFSLPDPEVLRPVKTDDRGQRKNYFRDYKFDCLRMNRSFYRSYEQAQGTCFFSGGKFSGLKKRQWSINPQGFFELCDTDRDQMKKVPLSRVLFEIIPSKSTSITSLIKMSPSVLFIKSDASKNTIDRLYPGAGAEGIQGLTLFVSGTTEELQNIQNSLIVLKLHWLGRETAHITQNGSNTPMKMVRNKAKGGGKSVFEFDPDQLYSIPCISGFHLINRSIIPLTDRRIHAIITIQKYWRQILAIREVARKRQSITTFLCAALTLQRVIRGHLVRKRLERLHVWDLSYISRFNPVTVLPTLFNVLSTTLADLDAIFSKNFQISIGFKIGQTLIVSRHDRHISPKISPKLLKSSSQVTSTLDSSFTVSSHDFVQISWFDRSAWRAEYSSVHPSIIPPPETPLIWTLTVESSPDINTFDQRMIQAQTSKDEIQTIKKNHPYYSYSYKHLLSERPHPKITNPYTSFWRSPHEAQYGICSENSHKTIPSHHIVVILRRKPKFEQTTQADKKKPGTKSIDTTQTPQTVKKSRSMTSPKSSELLHSGESARVSRSLVSYASKYPRCSTTAGFSAGCSKMQDYYSEEKISSDPLLSPVYAESIAVSPWESDSKSKPMQQTPYLCSPIERFALIKAVSSNPETESLQNRNGDVIFLSNNLDKLAKTASKQVAYLELS